MAMTTASLFPIATETVADSIRDIDGLDPAAPTPCQEWDAATLINHFTGSVDALVRIGRGDPLDPDNPWGEGLQATGGDWGDQLTGDLAELGTAWARSDAWQGSVSFGGSEMTAELVGQMAFAEAMLHGWDLTRSAGQPLRVSDEVGAELLRLVAATAELGRTMGAYGAEVRVADDRPAFDRALGLAGRDPDWAGQS